MSYQQEQVREWVWVTGQEFPDREWLNSPFDTWEKNPHYTGVPGRHPEEDYPEDHNPQDDLYEPWERSPAPAKAPAEAPVANYETDDWGEDDIPF